MAPYSELPLKLSLADDLASLSKMNVGAKHARMEFFMAAISLSSLSSAEPIYLRPGV